MEEIKKKTLSEINEKLLNLRFRNFTNINGENEYVGKQRKGKRRLHRKGKKEMPQTVEGMGQAKRRREKKRKDRNDWHQGQRQTKEKIRKRLRLHNIAQRKKSIDKRDQKIVVTLQYIMSAVE